ncbi:MAG: hypothetical protein JO340_21065 [Acidobacteriaceae bacterium]|nr:hypothetical protein [Acidobacteriaceae bacterium]
MKELRCAGRTDSVDELVVRASESILVPRIFLPFAVAAVGGYGRRELFPYSDVDLLLVVGGEADLERIKEPVSDFLRTLWDAKLRVSHSVRTVAECCQLNEQNIELHISLLDLRFVAGDGSLFKGLGEKLQAFYRRHGRALSQRLTAMTRSRHAKFNNTVYHLEPNVKEAPGTIRDIHFLHWMRLLLPGHEALDESYSELEGPRKLLYGIRCFLHEQAGRDNNLLSFELQDAAARLLPGDSTRSDPMQPEEWMRQYYGQARDVWQSALRALDYMDAQDTSLIRQFRERRTRLSTSEFTVLRDRVFLRNAAESIGSPEAVLRLFTFVARHGFGLSWDTHRRFAPLLPELEAAFGEWKGGWLAWREMLAQPHAALALHQMQESGALAAAIPEWRKIDSLVVRDFYHRYTVDEHTLVAIEAIDTLLAGSEPGLARMRDLLREEEDTALLRASILFHDIGKGTCAGDHIRGSIERANAVMERWAAPEAWREKIRLLIENHLVLSLIVNGRDPEDPATARFLTSKIGTREDLRRLTLLTYADVSAVNPTAMSPWRLEQLWRVYSMGEQQFMRELAEDRIHGAAPLPGGSPVRAELANFLEGLPARYARTHTRKQIEHHLELDQKRKREGVGVEVTPDAGAYLMTLLANDQPGLFAKLCGALASFGMNIVKAEAASNAAGCAVDLFRFEDPMRTLELNPSEVNRLQWTVECVVKGSVSVADLLKRRRAAPRPSRGARIAPKARFNNEASDTATLIDFTAEDRPGLLHDLASAIAAAECNIELLMIDTEAHRALDVFYVTRNGEKLDTATEEQLARALMSAGTAG